MNTPDGIPEAFREHFRRHNREAILITLITLAAAILLWTASYIAVYGLILLVTTALQGGEAGIPPVFLPVFAGCAIVLCLLALIMRKIRPGYFAVDHKSAFEVLMDILLVLPRVTFEVWGNFSAIQFPGERELQAAWRLLQTMGERGKLSIHQLPLEIPRQSLRARVVFLLQLAGLVEVRTYSDGLWLVLRGETARRLARSSVRIDPQLPQAALE